MKVRDPGANGGQPAAVSPARVAAAMVPRWRRRSGQSAGRLLIACGSLLGVRGM